MRCDDERYGACRKRTVGWRPECGRDGLLLQGRALRRAASRAAALEATATTAALERHPARDGVWAAQHPAEPADACGGLLRAGTGERGLPHPEHLDCRPRTRRKASGDGLVSRRRLPGRLGVAADLSRR